MTKGTAWPMQAPGGVFLIGIGSGIIVGAAMAAIVGGIRAFAPPMIAGALAGAVFLVMAKSWAGLGRPTRSQRLALLLAIAGEFAVFWYLGASGRFAAWDDRTIINVALGVVAAHFLVMRFAHGPMMLRLGAAALLWLGLANLLHLPLPLPLLILGDGLLKVGFGVAMARPLFAGGRTTETAFQP